MRGTEAKLIVGLGNHGKEFLRTKHNVGFLAIDYLAYQLGIGLRSNYKLRGLVGEKDGVILYKPFSSMNILGFNVAVITKDRKIKPENIMLVHDELELRKGICKFRDGNLSHIGHNGIKSVQKTLKNNNFKRIRIGIDRPKSRAPKVVGSYVLSDLSKNDISTLNDKSFPQVLDFVQNKFLI
ncbi:unnamed protein product [Moneuplotes crassus]|uniref:Peptidyl-tRNA hydrolase n=1 Tax=Euplotes crassus TaxID=5936 RepID=A0AAD2D7U9_EUPCR|nr:unnamed protein product [Moneuplotes crassus]